MPKERTPDVQNQAVTVEVGWRRHPLGDVQIGVTDDDSPYRHEDTGLPFNGWFASLDRDRVNKLIRDLRRARDAAYGRDE